MQKEAPKPLSWSSGNGLQIAVVMILLLSFSSCSVKTLGTEYPYQKIAVGAGPEDLILDNSTDPPRLLVSCDARRDNEPPQAGIWGLDLATGLATELPRIREPEFLVFHPHGIDLVRSEREDSGGVDLSDSSGAFDSTLAGQAPAPILYVISHDDERNIHSIYSYQVFADHLLYIRSWTDPLLVSPNAVCVLADGTLLVTNDSGKRGNRLEALLKQRKSNVVAWNPQTDRWGVVAGDLAYANGITSRGEGVYVATTRQNRVFSYHWNGSELTDRKEIAKVPGADNLRWDGNDLLVAGHPNIIAFVRHAGSASKKSPVEVWRVTVSPEKPAVKARSKARSSQDSGITDNTQAMEESVYKGPAARLIYATDGEPISASATALIYQNHLYLSQVFDPFILKVELPQP